MVQMRMHPDVVDILTLLYKRSSVLSISVIGICKTLAYCALTVDLLLSVHPEMLDLAAAGFECGRAVWSSGH